jgi:hypothetical protein
MSNTNTYLSPEEIYAYTVRGNTANTMADRSLAQLGYMKSMLENNYAQDKNRVSTAWDQNWNNQQGGFAHKGLFNSGIYSGAGTQWAQQKQNALADQQRAYQNNMGNYTQQELNTEAVRNSTLNQIAAEQQASQATKADQIRSVQ